MKKIILVFFLSNLFFSCSDKELTKSEIIGSYGAPGDWYFKFDSSLDLRSYLKDTTDIPDWMLELENGEPPRFVKKSEYDGIVYCEKPGGRIGIGLWKYKGISDWGGTKVFIKWQRYNGGVDFYRGGDWYFKKSGGTIYFTAGEKEFNSDVVTFPRYQ